MVAERVVAEIVPAFNCPVNVETPRTFKLVTPTPRNVVTPVILPSKSILSANVVMPLNVAL